MTHSNLVPNPIKHVHPKSLYSTKRGKFVDKSTGGDSSSNSKFQTRLSSMVGFRESLTSEGISGKAAELMSNARRKGTLRNYNATWKKWGMWCSERNTDPLNVI